MFNNKSSIANFAVLCSFIYVILLIIPNNIYKKVIPNTTIQTKLGFWDVNLPIINKDDIIPLDDDLYKEAVYVNKITNKIVGKKFFRIFQVELNKPCQYWNRKDICISESGSCSVCQCSPEEIPSFWIHEDKSSAVNYDTLKFNWNNYETKQLLGESGNSEKNFLNEISGNKKTFIDLQKNLPGNTAYSGRNIWSMIYNENCLTPKNCDENEHFVNIISGMQTCIIMFSSEYNNYNTSRLHKFVRKLIHHTKLNLSLIDLFYPQRNNNISYNYDLNLFRWKANNSQWIKNLYFDFSLLVRASNKLSKYITTCNCLSDIEDDDLTSRKNLKKLMEYIQNEAPSRTKTSEIFRENQINAIDRFTNVSNIIDCIECEKCRLHGKIKLTALQIVIKSLGQKNWQQVTGLSRNEIVALINSLNYFSEAILIAYRMKLRIFIIRSACLATVSLLLGSFILAMSKFVCRKKKRSINMLYVR